MAVLRRFGSLWRKTGWPERLFAFALVVYLTLVWIAPASAWRSLAGLALTIFGLAAGIRVARRGIRVAVWRLRNRLVVAYLFIAVAPIVLILALVSIGAYVLTGQVTVYLVTSAIERRTESMMGSARQVFASAPLRKGDGAIDGLTFKDDRLCLWAHAEHGSAQAVVLAPLTRQIFDGLVSDLGEITFVGGGPSAAPLARGGRIPRAANRFDIQVLWQSEIPVALWEQPGVSRPVPLGVVSRPSAVLRALFSERISTRGVWVTFFLIIAALFLVFELIALLIGISLTRTITGAVHGLHDGTQRVMRGDFSHRIEVRGSDQLADLGHSFNRMTENLQRLLRVEKEQERLQAELEIAREVQSQLYPKVVPAVPGLEVTAHCSPARTVSGDYYDYLSLPDSKLALAIGDVAGKGISAALLMATIQSSLRAQIRACLEAASSGSPSQLVTQLNEQLYADTSPEKYATFFFGIYDSHTGALTYTNAGHPPPIVIRDGSALPLETNGIVVGAFPFAEYGESRIELQPGDLLACFTDGLTEPENEYGEMFGEDRLTELLMRNSSGGLTEIMDTVYAAVRLWSWSPEGRDDMTMLLARKV
jgi:phosphoserine phosphatase RsbU/P